MAVNPLARGFRTRWAGSELVFYRRLFCIKFNQFSNCWRGFRSSSDIWRLPGKMNDSVSPLASRPASPAAPAHQDSSMGLPTLAEVLATPPPTSARPPFILQWGPVPLAASQAAGATFPASSVTLRPLLPTGVVSEALREIPSCVLPRSDDTVSSLVARLAQSSFLEDSHVLKGGCGPRRVRLNTTAYPQPRRRSWSVLVDVGTTATSLLNYTAYGRLPEDLEAVPMPRGEFANFLFDAK